ncbi:MAG: alkaline phosphatase family protein [Candidatus Atribacteria bacterium]|nr:alkaline phosphatase family protein [Candidatus Atribacteria bacterium]
MKINKEFTKVEKYFLIFRKYFTLLTVLLLLLSVFGLIGEASPKFLIFHLDALSSDDFFRYMDEGSLPNLKSVFEEGHMIHYGLSLFPGGTETIYPRLKEGCNNSIGDSVGWGYYDREKGRTASGVKTFSYLFSHIPRRAKASFIYGLPVLDTFNFLPLLNVPELLETYGVVEFIWFATDALGHMMGEKLRKASVCRFDRYFGKLIKRLDLNEVNIILYSDHGMSFGDFTIVDQNKEIERIVGKDVQAFLYPNLYLKDPVKKNKIARDIVEKSEIDFAFYRENPHQVVGYSNQGKMIFEEKDEKYRYSFEGKDVFSYDNLGYKGEWLTALKWLTLTRESRFPGVPSNIYNLLLNKRAGDIVVVINPPRIVYTYLHYSANHNGLINTDLMMPILLRGKQLEPLYSREEMWLHNLYSSIPELSFEDLEPEREKNSFTFWKKGHGEDDLSLEMNLSPAYRWNIGLGYSDDIYRGWVEYDIYSSYFIRLWTGAGLKYQEEQTEPFVQARLQMDFGKIQFNCGWQYDQEGWKENTKQIVYQINDRLALEWFVPDGFGLSLSW